MSLQIEKLKEVDFLELIPLIQGKKATYVPLVILYNGERYDLITVFLGDTFQVLRDGLIYEIHNNIHGFDGHKTGYWNISQALKVGNEIFVSQGRYEKNTGSIGQRVQSQQASSGGSAHVDQAGRNESVVGRGTDSGSSG